MCRWLWLDSLWKMSFFPFHFKDVSFTQQWFNHLFFILLFFGVYTKGEKHKKCSGEVMRADTEVRRHWSWNLAGHVTVTPPPYDPRERREEKHPTQEAGLYCRCVCVCVWTWVCPYVYILLCEGCVAVQAMFVCVCVCVFLLPLLFN